ncbi:dihydropteroate synthase [Rubrolithibacter danxiaensis]|uniref:dihydropteroate synthase n=1 Tax=Rubrolithibacter danxiaensis TaxID=3390805 RepID=UPI003BF7C3E3
MRDKNTFFHQKKTLNVRGELIDLSVPKIMGILNLTPDSFYDGGRNNSAKEALKKTHSMLEEGATFIDIGAYSSRPGAEHITEQEELQRLIPTLKALVKEFPKALISIDTFRAGIAKAAVSEGAHIINDISAGEMDIKMFTAIAELQVPYILMHMKGTPQTMLQEAKYEDVFMEVYQYFIEKIARLTDLGVKDLIIDPGFGFAKQPQHSYQLLNKLDQFRLLGHPVLAGVSRKSMIYKTIGSTSENALNGTTVANTIALMKGANILRVHDVRAATEAVTIVAATTQTSL